MKALKPVLLLCALAWGAMATAALPPPSPAQAKEAAAKKAAADAKAAKEKEQLAASMDALSTRWRQRALDEGWKIKPPVTVPTATGAPVNLAAGAAPTTNNVAAGIIVGTPRFNTTPPDAGAPAAPPVNAARGSAGAAPATGAAPHSPQALNSANVPVKSEKLGTARPSEDVKKGPTRAEPKNAPPTVNKANVPANAGGQ